LLAGLAALLSVLLLLACDGAGGRTQGDSPTPEATPSRTGMPALPPWAYQLQVRILSPADHTRLRGSTLRLKLAFGGYMPDCLLAGTPAMKRSGLFEVLLDGVLVDAFCSPTVDLSMQNVRPGAHTVTVVPALNDHAPVDRNATSLHFDYQPTTPLPWIGPAQLGPPTLKILAPAAGTEVHGLFTIAVAVNDFQLSCSLRGKANVPGYGSWGVNLDTLNGPGAGMATRAAISCASTVTLSTAGMTPGQHVLIAYLADDRAQPVLPLVGDQVVVDVVD
jgi:hypothetical protein